MSTEDQHHPPADGLSKIPGRYVDEYDEPLYLDDDGTWWRGIDREFYRGDFSGYAGDVPKNLRRLIPADVDEVQPLLDENERLLAQWADEARAREAAEAALTQIRALCDANVTVWGDSLQANLIEVDRLRAVLDAVSVDAAPQGIDRDKAREALDDHVDRYWHGDQDDVLDALAECVRPVEGVVLGPEDCSRLMGAVVRGGFRTEDPADQALATRLEASS